MTHLRTINNPAVEISGAQFQQEEVLILGEGGESLTFSNGFLLFACFGLLAWETVTGRQLQCEKNLSSNRPTFVKNRATIDIKTKAISYGNILIPDVVTLEKYDVRNIALTI